MSLTCGTILQKLLFLFSLLFWHTSKSWVVHKSHSFCLSKISSFWRIVSKKLVMYIYPLNKSQTKRDQWHLQLHHSNDKKRDTKTTCSKQECGKGIPEYFNCMLSVCISCQYNTNKPVSHCYLNYLLMWKMSSFTVSFIIKLEPLMWLKSVLSLFTGISCTSLLVWKSFERDLF